MQFKKTISPELLELAVHLPAWVWNMCIIALSVAIGLIVKYISTRIFKYYSKRNEGPYSAFRSVVVHMSLPVTWFLILVVFNFMTGLLQTNLIALSWINRITEIALIICFSSVLIHLMGVLEDYVYYKYDLTKTDNLKERKIRTQLKFLRKLVVMIIVFVTIALILLSFESMRKLGTGLLTGVGIGGIIVGFAAQSSLGNLLAGMQLAFTQPIRIDDVLVVEGEWGRVEDITLTYVVLRIWDQRRLILPINYFITKPFQNWTRISAEIIGTVFIYMDYTVPMDELRAEFERLITAHRYWDGRVKALQVTDSKEHTIEIRMLMSSRNSSDAFDLRCDIREAMINYIQQRHPLALPKLRTDLNNNTAPLAVNNPPY